MSWRWGYQWGSHILDTRSGIQIYEEAYYRTFKNDKKLLEYVCASASDCYDTSVTNVHAYCDYNFQEVEGACQHWQDVSVRRCLLRAGRWFKGDHLLEIRGHESEVRTSRFPFTFSSPHYLNIFFCFLHFVTHSFSRNRFFGIRAISSTHPSFRFTSLI